MPNSGEILSIVLVTGEFFLSILVNGFIAMVNCTDWVRNKKLLTNDIILVSLAISRIGLVCIIIWKSYLVINDLYAFILDGIKIIDIFLTMAHSSSIWFDSVLSIFYFLKIANFSNPFFLWMKWRIDRMIYMLLAGPLIIYLFICFLASKKMYFYSENLFREKKENVSQEFQMSAPLFIMFQILFSFLNLIPFTLTVVSFSLLILSLWRHTCQMQLNATGSRDPKIEAHVRAIKAVSSFIILFLLYYIGFCFNYWSYIVAKSKVFFVLGMAIVLLYPLGHSLILILWNSKLKKVALRMWWKMRCYQRGSNLKVFLVPVRIIWHFLRGKKSAWSP
ncbi:taste receptor type 2 member 7-like [Gracilinanus agilis]|uniref:taste receptor type 2 member 7-like n=1 Tax=Gracilinanus agilis TaxID=191870 RepID=UPI001CFCB1C9|nr:taste receptor type 2 member 7-like [Gracilinanus agilis]